MAILTKPYKILVIDDDEGDYFLVNDYLSESGADTYFVEWAPTYEAGAAIMAEARHDLYLIDHLLGAGTGLELIRHATEKGCRAPKVLLTGLGNRELDLQAIKAGADDYLPKTMLNHEILERVIRHSLERFEQRLLLEQQEARYKTLFEQSNDPIYVTDTNWKFTAVNNSLLNLFNWNIEVLLEKNLADLFVSGSAFISFREQVDNEGFVSDFTGDFRVNNDTAPIIAIISASPVYDHQQKIVGYQGMIHDITKLKKAERDMAMAEQLNMTGRMASIIAHEVRNPLTNINLASGQLEESLTEQQDLVFYTEIIKRSSDRINALISDLLNSTRLAQLELIPYPVGVVLDHVLELCGDRIHLKGVTLDKAGLDNQVAMLIDPEKLKIAFVNMITNCIEAMDGIDAPSLSVSLEMLPSEAYIRVTDNGKGMDEHTRKHLFEAFFTKRQGGMGLGMTTVQNIILQHNGRIEVESEPGKGTTFNVYLRRVEE